MIEPRFEFTFSYWIFAWFLIYYIGFIKYNPKIWLIIGLFQNIFGGIVTGVVYKYIPPYIDIFLHVLINTFIKVIPILLLWNTPLTMVDFIAGLVLFLVMFLWMYIRLGSVKAIMQYINTMNSQHTMVEKKTLTPLIYYLHKSNIV
jgi:hypothetical protein